MDDMADTPAVVCLQVWQKAAILRRVGLLTNTSEDLETLLTLDFRSQEATTHTVERIETLPTDLVESRQPFRQHNRRPTVYPTKQAGQQTRRTADKKGNGCSRSFGRQCYSIIWPATTEALQEFRQNRQARDRPVRADIRRAET